MSRFQVRAYGKGTFRVFDTKLGKWASPGTFISKRKAAAFSRMCTDCVSKITEHRTEKKHP